MSKARVPHGDQRALKILFGKAVIHDADEDAVHLGRLHAGMGECRTDDGSHQFFRALMLELAER